jgi:O-antigen/teichoic acid export membrane protein
VRFALRNLAGNYAVYAASIVSGIVLTPVIIGAIGKDGYGVWVFIGSVTIFLRTLDLGLAPAIVRYSAYYRGRRDTAAISEVASCGFALYVGISALLALAGVLFAVVLPSIESIHGELVHPARVAAFVTVLTLALELPIGAFSNLLKGQQRFDIVNAGSLVSLVVYATLVAAVLTSRDSVAWLAAIAFVATMIRVLVPAMLIRRELPDLRLSPRLVTRSRLRELLSFSGFAFVSHIAAKIVFAADAILIGIVLGPVAVATYGVASRLFTVGSGLSSTGTDVLFPAYSELEGRGDLERQRQYVEGALRSSLCMVVLVTAPLLVVPAWVIGAWLPGRWDASVAPLVLLAATLYFTQPIMVMSQFLLGRGRPRPLAFVQISFGIVNLVATLVLLLAIGRVWAAALATLVLEVGVGAIALPLLVARDGITYRLLVSAWSRPVAAGLVASSVTLVPAAVLWHDSHSLPGVLAVGAVWSVVYAALAWRVALGPPERAFVRRTLANARRPVAEAA